MIVAWRNGAPVRLEQLANVVDGVENDKMIAWYNDERGVILAIQRQPGTNTVEVVDNIRRLLPDSAARDSAGGESAGRRSTLPNPSATRFTTWSSRCC